MRAAALALLVALAGCSGIAGQWGEPTEAVTTPAPVPTAGPAALADVPGFGPSGVTDLRTFLSAHEARLGTFPNPRVRRTVVVTYRFANGTTERLRHVDVTNGERHLDAWRGKLPFSPGAVRAYAAWRNDTMLATRTVAADGTVSLRAQGPTGYVFLNPVFPLDLRSPPATVAREDPRLVGRRDRNGTTEFLLVARGLDPETVRDVDTAFADSQPGDRPYRAGTLERAGPGRLRAVVTEAGLVRRLEVRVPARAGDASLVVNATVTYDRVGTATAPPPGWVEDAVAESGDGPGDR